MDVRAVDHSVNIIGVRKDNTNYVMCCAWSMNVDYDKIMSLVGSQSVTGRVIKKGDIIGFSSLKLEQKNIAGQIGDGHSNEKNKLENIKYHLDDSAIIIDDALTMLKCEVIDILHPQGIELDNLLYLKVLDGATSEGKALHMSDM